MICPERRLTIEKRSARVISLNLHCTCCRKQLEQSSEQLDALWNGLIIITINARLKSYNKMHFHCRIRCTQRPSARALKLVVKVSRLSHLSHVHFRTVQHFKFKFKLELVFSAWGFFSICLSFFLCFWAAHSPFITSLLRFEQSSRCLHSALGSRLSARQQSDDN